MSYEEILAIAEAAGVTWTMVKLLLLGIFGFAILCQILGLIYYFRVGRYKDHEKGAAL
jgi:hypothetical protein